MISYFKELENPNGHYIDFSNVSSCEKNVDLKTLPLTFFEKYIQLFRKIEEYDLLFEKNQGKKLYLNPNFNDQNIPVEVLYDSFINGSLLDNMSLSKNGIEKLYFLKKEYSNRYRGNDFISDFQEYFLNIYNYFLYSERLIDCSRKNIFKFLLIAKTMAQYQGKLTPDDEMLFEEALKYIRNYTIVIPNIVSKPFRIHLPNSWYITPYNHLYNSMGLNGHKEANLIYPFNSIIRGAYVHNFSDSLKKAKTTLENGCIDRMTFDYYTHLHFGFSAFYPESYFQLDEINQMVYRLNYQKTYNPKIVKLIAGIQSAHAGLFSFFYFLKNNSSDYYSELNFIRQFGVDEILVRCCGFHKVSSVCDKTITTSCIRYEEELSEYIKRGWKIDFVKPIILNPSTKKLEEYSDDFLLIKKMHY